MFNLRSFMIGTGNFEAMVAFYEKVFGRKPDMFEDGWAGWKAGDGFLSVGKHSEVKGVNPAPQRCMLNLETEEVKQEFERLVQAGATVVKEPYDMGEAQIATLADPDGNYFQLMTPWSAEQ